MLILLLLLPALLYAQLPDSVWSRVYGREHNQRCVAAAQTDDRGYALAGNFDYGERVSDFYLMIVYDNGDTISTHRYDIEQGMDVCTCMRGDGSDGYVIGGWTTGISGFMMPFVRYLGRQGGEYSNYADESGRHGLFTAIGDGINSRTLLGASVADTTQSYLEVVQLEFGSWERAWTIPCDPPSEIIALWALSVDEVLVAGTWQSGELSGQDFMLMKYAADGGLAWRRSFGGPSDDHCTSAIQTSDGGYLLAGWTQSFGSGDFDYWLLKLSADGDSLWSRNYGGDYWDQCTSVVETPTGYLLAGKREDNNDGNFQLWVVATDFAGDRAQTVFYGGTEDEDGAVIIPTADHGFAFAGTTRSFGSLGWNIWLLKTVYLSHIAVDRTSIVFGGVHLGDSTSRVLNILNIGGVAATVTALDFPPAFHTSLTFPYELAAGETLATPIVFAPQDPGTYIDTLFIHSNSVTDPGPVRLVGSGLSVSAEPQPAQLPAAFALLGSYPNPFNARARIAYALPVAAWIELAIYNLHGERVSLLVSGNQPAGQHHAEFNATGLASGIYVARLTTPTSSFSHKLVLLR